MQLMDVKYPVLQPSDYKLKCYRAGIDSTEYVPYGLLLPHENQAKLNHGGQSLERLKERGGLDYCEMLCIIEDRKWPKEWYSSGLPPYEEVRMRKRVLAYVWEYLDSRHDLPPYWERYKSKLEAIINGTLD